MPFPLFSIHLPGIDIILTFIDVDLFLIQDFAFKKYFLAEKADLVAIQPTKKPLVYFLKLHRKE